MFAGFLNLSCFLKEKSLSQSVNQTSRSAYDLVRWNNRKDMITETGLGDWSFVMEILPLSWIRNWTVPTKWAQLVHSSYWRALNSVSAKSLSSFLAESLCSLSISPSRPMMNLETPPVDHFQYDTFLTDGVYDARSSNSIFWTAPCTSSTWLCTCWPSPLNTEAIF